MTGDAISDGTTNDTVTVMGRTHWSVLKSEAGFLHLGGWGVVEDLTPATTLASRNLVVASRGNDNLRLSSGTYANPKGASGFGLEFRGVHRAFWAMAEGGKRVVRTAGRDFDKDAFSLSTGFFLTGETPPLSTRTGTWTRPKVANPLGVDGYGAVEVVGRYDTADFTDSLTGGKGETWLLGVSGIRQTTPASRRTGRPGRSTIAPASSPETTRATPPRCASRPPSDARRRLIRRRWADQSSPVCLVSVAKTTRRRRRTDMASA